MRFSRTHGGRGFKNRRVSRASTEISREIVCAGLRIRAGMTLEPVAHRHHESWCAIATLRRVRNAHRLLRGRQDSAALHAFNSDNVRAVELRH